MLQDIRYDGILIGDTGIRGQRKSEGIIAASQTMGPGSSAPRPTEPEMAVAGLHCATLTYDGPVDADWQLANGKGNQ